MLACSGFIFAYAKCWFSHDAAQILSKLFFKMYIIRIYHEFVGTIDNFVLRVTVWHQENPPSDAKQ